MSKNLGKRLLRARKASGFGLRKLAELIGLSHMAVSKYEKGASTPSSDILLKLAKALKVSVEFFLRPETIKLGEIKFRKRQHLRKKVEESIKAQIADQIERRLELENLYPNPPIQSFKIPDSLSDQIDEYDQIEEVANKLRNYWKLGRAPIQDLIDVLESHGVRVFIIDYEEKMFDGLSTLINEQPIIVISSKWPGDRQRFTLAHELGHFILQGKLSKELKEEKACNRFAGAFLLSKETIVQEMGRIRTSIEWRELYLLKEEFKLSMYSICYRLKDVGIIKESYFKSLVFFFNQKGWNKQEPGSKIPSEKTHIFKQMVFHALGEEYIGESKAAELLDYSIEAFRNFRLMDETRHAATR
ncbi:MAG: ImmA/IrrE family metallo-endopeptidase [Rhabdochlamydiaceae bacterium]|nr:ImmA/IrrE family metallo-endopeptidase [Rhabdochlamydiaceae bacterium]